MKHSAIIAFHEDNYQHLLSEGKNTHQITDFEEHFDRKSIRLSWRSLSQKSLWFFSLSKDWKRSRQRNAAKRVRIYQGARALHLHSPKGNHISKFRNSRSAFQKWKLFDPLCEVDESYSFLKYNFYPRMTRKVQRKFKDTLNKIIDKHFTMDFEMRPYRS